MVCHENCPPTPDLAGASLGSYELMPSREVMHKFKAGKLHSGSKTGPKVKSRKQAIAIKLSEEKAEKKGKRK